MSRRLDVGLGDVAPLVMAGRSDSEIAAQLGVSRRTVQRLRERVGLVSRWTPLEPPHGTPGRYARGCSCEACRDAHNAAVGHWAAVCQRLTANARNYAQPWTAEDDALALDSSAGTIAQRALQLGRTFAATRSRIHYLRQQRKGAQTTAA